MRSLLAAMLAAATPIAAAPPDADHLGVWRITHGVVAPWTVDAAIDETMVGKRVVFGEKTVVAPKPLACRNAKYEATAMPPDGLFQGGLPTPPNAAARALGFAEGEVAGVSLTCDSGIWEFHDADVDTTLFALDNVIWTMSRAYGATARPGSPESVVQGLLEFHFNHDYGFLKAAADARKKWMSAALARKVDDYFKREFGPDLVPPINGDPFTDSQEFPTRFAVRKGATAPGAALVPVDFADGYVTKRVVYRLAYGAKGWRVDDLIYSDGSTLTEAFLMPVE
ncbi:MAG: hypothetical protein HXY23_11435 [Parvularculaceae bacterium]|jgi:hypothetical protein|nr:hypothetical protein [Parvularculaceae bacterium]